MPDQPPIPDHLWAQIPPEARAALLLVLQRLDQRIRDLEQRLGQNSSNSSVPPSANPLTAPAPAKKTPSGRKPGGQPGHHGHRRQRLPVARVDHVIALIPSRCERGHAALPPQPQPDDPEPTWHQVCELPRQSAVVTEFQGHARTCPCCQHVTREVIPSEISADAFGPRLAAAVGYLAATQQVSVRGVEDICAALFGVPVSVGGIAALRADIGAALVQPHEQAQAAARDAAVKNADETTWKLAGRTCWLWVAVTCSVVYYLIRPRRNAAALHDLMGQHPRGVLVTDRAKAYGGIPDARRQFCWAHLKRDFQAMVDRKNAGSDVGRRLLNWTAAVFEDWHDLRQGKIDRRTLRTRMDLVQFAVRLVLQSGAACGCAATAGTCRELLGAEASLWVFVAHEGVEPTNNAAERALRRGVLWRKRSFGSTSEGGLRFVERILTVTGTLRLRGRNVLEFLREAVSAHRHQLPAPCLFTSG